VQVGDAEEDQACAIEEEAGVIATALSAYPSRTRGALPVLRT
jgi:hypothetical protein